VIEIQEVLKKVSVGYCTPYLCRGSDGERYYVKAANEGVLQHRDLIHEWLCAHLGQAWGLPVPECSLCSIPHELFEVLPDHLQGIGHGVGFASKAVPEPIWFESNHMMEIPKVLKRDLLLFDYWVMNMDRTAQNTNLLLSAPDIKQSQELRVIDHNLAFDPEFNEVEFFSEGFGHIFATEKEGLFNDLALRSELSMRMDRTLDSYHTALNKLPVEWAWRDIEQTIPIDVDYSAIWAILTRYQQNDFWSMK